MAKLSTEELLDQFKQLTLIELSEFVKQFEETFGVTAAAPQHFRPFCSALGGRLARKSVGEPVGKPIPAKLRAYLTSGNARGGGHRRQGHRRGTATVRRGVRTTLQHRSATLTRHAPPLPICLQLWAGGHRHHHVALWHADRLPRYGTSNPSACWVGAKTLGALSLPGSASSGPASRTAPASLKARLASV